MTLLRTDKQIEIMKIVLGAADAGDFLTVTEIANAISYGAAYGSVRTSLRFLVKHGMLVREKVGRNSMMKPTAAAYERFRKSLK